MNFQCVVMNVEDLDRTIEFYREVFGFTLLSQRDQLAAMNAPGTERPQVIVFRSIGTASARRVMGGRHVGIRGIVLEVDTLDEFERISAELDKRGSLVSRHGDDDKTWISAFGRDPDHTAVVVGATLTDKPISLDAWTALHDALYAVGE